MPPLCTLLILLQGWWQRRFWLLLTISRLFAPPQGFTWAFLSGVSEPIGALMGYLVLNGNNDLSFAIVFGLVAGGWMQAGDGGRQLPYPAPCRGRRAGSGAHPLLPLHTRGHL